MNTTIGCKLPNGYTIEWGTPGNQDYGYAVIPPRRAGKDGSGLVPIDKWQAWKKINAKLRYLLDGSIYEVKT